MTPASPSLNMAPSVATRQLKLAGEWEAHGDAVWALAYGGGCVFSGSHAGVIKQWNAARSWSCVRAVQVFLFFVSFFFFKNKSVVT
jgi:homoserine kinase